MMFLRKYPNPIAIFNKAEFLKEKPESVSFLSQLLETQAFSFFLDHHHQTGENLFDDAILSMKENKPTYKMENHKTTIQKTFEVPGPNSIGLKESILNNFDINN